MFSDLTGDKEQGFGAQHLLVPGTPKAASFSTCLPLSCACVYVGWAVCPLVLIPGYSLGPLSLTLFGSSAGIPPPVFDTFRSTHLLIIGDLCLLPNLPNCHHSPACLGFCGFALIPWELRKVQEMEIPCLLLPLRFPLTALSRLGWLCLQSLS